MTQQDFDRVETWTFAGRQCDPTGKTVQVRYEKPDGSFAYFDLGGKNRRSHAKIIGGRYEVQIVKTDDSDRYRLADAAFSGRLDDTAKIAGWQAADATVDATLKSLKDLAAGKTDELEALMAPLRRAYAALPFMQRPAFELWVLGRLRRGKV